MSRPNKIVQHKLEKQALQHRNHGRNSAQTAKLLTTALKRKGVDGGVSRAAVERYWASLDKASVAPAHQPQVAEDNAALAINVGGDLQQLATTLREWFDEAQGARVYHVLFPEATDEDPTPEPIKVDLGPDWKVRLSTSREFRETLKFAAELLERIYNAEQVREFQQAVLAEVTAADPMVARRIRDRLASRQELVRAQLLGL